jgi:hypothetical protein
MVDENKSDGGFFFITDEPIPTFIEWMEIKLHECIEVEDYEEAEKLKKDINNAKKNSVVIKI